MSSDKSSEVSRVAPIERSSVDQAPGSKWEEQLRLRVEVERLREAEGVCMDQLAEAVALIERLRGQADDAYRSLRVGRVAEAEEYLRTMRHG